MYGHSFNTNLGKLVLGGKLTEKQLAENPLAESLSQEQKIISDKCSANFAIVLCEKCELLHPKL